MKTTIGFSELLPLLLTGLTSVTSAQQFVSTPPAPPAYQISARGPNHRQWEQVISATNADGSVTSTTNSFFEISPGVCRASGGQWVDCFDQIQVTGTGAESLGAQHQVTFLGNINAGGTNGAVSLVTPEGKKLASNILGLSYWDTNSGTSVFIADLTDSTGQLLSSGDAAVYTNAFYGVHADVYYENRVSQFEQLVVLRQQLPDPLKWNMDPASTMFQVITEFIDPPVPAVVQVPTELGLDVNLDFGIMQMIKGEAFAIGPSGDRIPVLKQWLVLDGRTCLVEQIPFTAIQPLLQDLPPSASADRSSPVSPQRLLARVAGKRALPARKVAKKTSSFRMAHKRSEPKGFAMDYTLVTSATNMVFASDKTYLITNGLITLSGSNVFCGGAVIKMGVNSGINIAPSTTVPTVTFLGAQYQPTIFTAIDDSSWGEKITTNSPSGYYANPAINIAGIGQTPVLNYVRFAYAKAGITFNGVNANVNHAQFVNCQSGISPAGANIGLFNVLFCNAVTNIAGGGSSHVTAENGTFSGSAYLVTSPASDSTNSTFVATNCVFAAVTNLTAGSPLTNGDYNGFYQTAAFGYDQAPTVAASPFQSVGAGYYYLAADSPYRNAGTTNIDGTLLSALQLKTTYPPLYYTNNVVVNSTLYPQAQRDYDEVDLGFHYDPLDFLIGCTVSNATLVLTNGIAIAYYNNGGVWLQNSSSLISFGGPKLRNWLVHYSLVQEEPLELAPSGSSHTTSMPVNTYHDTTPADDPSLTFRFTSVAAPVGASYILYTDNGNWETVNTTFQDCELWGCGTWLSLESGATASTITLQNNLIEHTGCTVWTPGTATAYNNLFHSGTNLSAWIHTYFGSGSITTRDNAFDGCTVNLNGTTGNNAYLNGAVVQSSVQTNDITTNLTWQAGPLGNFYQPTNSPLINKGSRGADLAALFHYTVVTNLVNNLEIKETNSVVDIGCHYVAVDANGNPIDTNVDGIPDWLSDSNGNGQVDSGEIGWNMVGDLGLKVLITRPQANSVIP